MTLSILEFECCSETNLLLFQHFSQNKNAITLSSWLNVLGDHHFTTEQFLSLCRELVEGFTSDLQNKTSNKRKIKKAASKKKGKPKQARECIGLRPISEANLDAISADVKRCQRSMELKYEQKKQDE